MAAVHEFCICAHIKGEAMKLWLVVKLYERSRPSDFFAASPLVDILTPVESRSCVRGVVRQTGADGGTVGSGRLSIRHKSLPLPTQVDSVHTVGRGPPNEKEWKE